MNETDELTDAAGLAELFLAAPETVGVPKGVRSRPLGW